MTMRFPGRAALAAAAVLAAIAAAVPASASPAGLPHLDITGVYVAGVSSGGFMATQLQVAYPGTFDGAGIIAAGPYGCGQGNVTGFATCDIGASLPALEQQAVTWPAGGLIDPVTNLAGKPVYVYHGTLDPVVSTWSRTPAWTSTSTSARTRNTGTGIRQAMAGPPQTGWCPAR